LSVILIAVHIIAWGARGWWHLVDTNLSSCILDWVLTLNMILNLMSGILSRTSA
jgi:hypothetical protein